MQFLKAGPMLMIISLVLCGLGAVGSGSDVDEMTKVVGGRAAPVITGLTVYDITDTSATVHWVTDINGTSSVFYRTENASVLEQGESVNNTAFTMDHNITLTGLTPLTQYFYLALSKSETNENGSSTVYDFTTSAAPAPVNQPPEISGVEATGITETSATITWTTNELTKGTVYYGTSDADLSQEASEDGFKESHSQEITSLTPATTYFYKITVVDSDDAATESDIYNFTTNESAGGSGGAPNTELSGTVVDEEGEPVEGAMVVVVGTEFNTTTDADGKYTITGLEPDEYTVNITSGTHLSIEETVTISADEKASLDVTLKVDPDRDGDGIPNEWEELYGLDPDDPEDAVKDEDEDGFTNLEEFEEETDPTDKKDIPLDYPTNLESYGFNLLELSVELGKDEKTNDINSVMIIFIFELREPQDFRKDFLDEGPEALGLEGDKDGEVTGKEVKGFEDEFADVLEREDDFEAPVLFDDTGPADNPEIEVVLDDAEDLIGSGDDITLTIKASYNYELEGEKRYDVEFDLEITDVPEESFILEVPSDWEMVLDTLDPEDMVDHFSKDGGEVEDETLEDLKTRDISRLAFQVKNTERVRDETPGFEAFLLLATVVGLLAMVQRRKEH